MTDLNKEVCELTSDEMTGEELDTVTGGHPIITAIVSALASYDKWAQQFKQFHIATELF